jgi:iron complex outermembrane recepter protein
MEGDELPNATVVFAGRQVLVTDVHGDFEVRGLARGRYVIAVHFLGYDSVRTSVDILDRDVHLDFRLRFHDLQLDEVVVIGDHYKTGRVEQALTVRSVGEDYFRRQNAGTLINSLEKVPGISAINTGVGIAKPVIRGMSFNRVIVMDKGVKQEGQQWGADHGLEIDQYDPERVEIVKGPASLLYGSDGIAGVIRILPISIPAKDHLRGSLFATYKSNNRLFGTSAMLEGKQGMGFFRARLSTQDFADYGVPAQSFSYNGYILPIYGQRLVNTAGRERNFSLSGGLAGSRVQSSVTISNFNQKAGLFPGATGVPRAYQLEPDGNIRNIGLPRQRTNHLKVISNTVVEFGRNWLESDLGYQFNDRNEEGQPHAHGYQPTPEGDLALGLDLHTWSANLRYNYKTGEKLSSVLGVQGQYQINRHSGFEFLLPDFSSSNAGVYTYHEYSPSHTFSASGGFRFDAGRRRIDAHTEPDYTTPEPGDSVRRNGAIDRQFQDFSFALGASYYPTLRFNAKLNLGSSFRMPTAPELSSNGIHHGTFRHEVGDSTLRSERGLQADLNLTYTSNKLYLLVTPFASYFDQYIYLGPESRFSELPAGGQVYRYKQHNAVFTGIELEADYRLIRTLAIHTGMEYVWNRNLETTLPLPFTPPFSALLELRFEPGFGGERWSGPFLNFGAKYYAAQNRVDRNEKPTPGYFLLNFNSGVSLHLGGQRIDLMLSGTNLGNVRYMNHLSRYRLLNLPEQGRNLVFSINFPFEVRR